MNKTARLTGWIAVALSFSVGMAAAGPLGDMAILGMGAATVGQADGPSASPAQRRQQADDCLRRARELMAKNDLAGADQLITQAEGLQPQYPAFYFGDTPKKVRESLEKMRSAAGGPAKPSQMFSPFGASKKAAPADPFRRPGGNVNETGAAGTSPSAQQFTGLPSTGRPDTGSELAKGQGRGGLPAEDDLRLPPALARGYEAQGDSRSNVLAAPKVTLFNGQQAFVNDVTASRVNTQPATGDRARSDDLLRAGRRALAVGDLRRAAEFAQQAKPLQVRYEPSADSPQKLETAIARRQEVDRLDKTSDANRHQYARMLMEEAEALMTWNEYEHAEQLASLAARLQVQYGPMEAKPEGLLARIAAARNGGRPAAAASSAGPGSNSGAGATLGPSLAARQQVANLLRQARSAMMAGQLDQAEALARQADQLRIPDSAFSPGEDRPGLVMLDLRQARLRNPSGVTLAGGASAGAGDRYAAQAVYDPSSDPTRNMQVADQQIAPPEAPNQLPPPPGAPLPAAPPATSPGVSAQPGQSQGNALFQQGEAALKAHDKNRALDLFRQAVPYMSELDQVTAQRLQDHLQILSRPANGGKPPQPVQPGSQVNEAMARQHALVQRVHSEVVQMELNARKTFEKDPKGAVAILEQARKKVETSGLDSSYRDNMLRRLDRSLNEMRQFMAVNGPRIELDEKNNRTREEIARAGKQKEDVQQKLAAKVDEYNRCLDEHRYAEAMVVAKQAAELAPKEPVTTLMLTQSKTIYELDRQRQMRDGKEKGVLDALQSIDVASKPFDDSNPILFPDAKEWKALSNSRARREFEKRHRFNDREIEIQKRLKTPVSVAFKGTPLTRAVETLAKMTGVNIHIDEEALKQEGISPDTPVNLEVNEITLRSVLNLILNNHHLAYVVKDEVLKITSEQMRAGQVYTVTYNVADLVLPIPNFVGGPRLGLAGAYADAIGSVNGGGGPFGTVTTPMATLASADGKKGSAAISPALLAQIQNGSRHVNVPGNGGAGQPMGFGPGGVSGGSGPDFDSLIDLVTSTVQPTTWAAAGGPGSIGEFPSNLSVVITNTQEVHDEVVDLLEQLRRMQDLQVTIEVRFITLNDNFFERIGVDFDFNIRDKNTAIPEAAGFSPIQQATVAGQTVDTRTRQPGAPGTAIVGLQQVGSNPASNGVYTADLDIPFRQGSYALAVPQFGGFDAAAGASLGFAILSDIEAFFFINAAQGDRRSNVLQAPKVTLFNGQQAFVSDTSQTPFVISVVPVVGDFAAAQQPVIVVLSEGTHMTVQAVVSNDRRFVRLTIVPFFSKIGKVDTFTFQGSETTTTDVTREGVVDPAKDLFRKKSNKGTTSRQGTTVQLPTFSFVTVTTTVSVPDGGTVLLGGIKRLSEGRNEFGTPILDKIPYINRLFKNVGIGREASSLMMMVTPRIIIQEEEEEKIGVTAP